LSVTNFLGVLLTLKELSKGGAVMSPQAPSRDSRWQRFYDAALVELNPEKLARRVAMARKAIHARIVELRNTGEADELWGLMDALRILDDLLKMNRISPSK
jgi:hypothetical protein